MSLVLDRVSFSYPGTSTGLTDVSLNIDAGELVAVIGPSGSGKSTLLKLIAGLTTGYSGIISLDGQDLAHQPVHKRNIGVVFQNYALFPHLNVLDNIAYGLKMRKVALAQRHQRARELLDIVGMSVFAERSISQLSGGQQQRVALTRALAINPSALLLDEPLAALDASIRGHLRDQIRQVQKRFNATTLLVTHDQEEALTMADRVAVMKDGQLLQLDTPKTLYDAPKTRSVAEFVGSSTIFPAKVSAINQVDLGFARLSAPTANRCVGAAVFVLIRPEHVQADPSAGQINCLTGNRGLERYLGATYRYDFHLPGSDHPVLVESSVLAQHAIAIAPEHIRLLDH